MRLTLNRSALVVKPKQPFLDWLHAADSTSSDLTLQELVSSTAFDPTLRHTVLPGALEGGADRAYPHGSNGRGNLQPVFRIVVEDQKHARRLEWKRLP